MTDDRDLVARINNQQFLNMVTEAALEKLILELKFSDLDIDEHEITKMRSAIVVGVTETVIQLRKLVQAALEEGED